MEIKRSLESVRTGGADITCIPGISVEVKRKKEVLPGDMASFWKQCLSQAETENCKPVLFTKEDRLPIGMDIRAFKIIYERWNNE